MSFVIRRISVLEERNLKENERYEVGFYHPQAEEEGWESIFRGSLKKCEDKLHYLNGGDKLRDKE